MTPHWSSLGPFEVPEAWESKDQAPRCGAPAFSRLAELDFESLVALADAAEPRATEELLSRLRPMMQRYCRARLGRVGGSFDEADEVTQQACVAVLAALPRYGGGGGSFTAFAFGIAARTVDGCHGRIPSYADADRARALLDQLPNDLRHLLVLRVAVGLSTEATGRAVGMSPDAVRAAQRQALSRFRAVVGREDPVGTIDGGEPGSADFIDSLQKT